MKLEHSFTVPVGVEQAWNVLLDIERIAPCMPGAALDSVDGDSFTGRVKIKLGPINLTYKGAASFVEKDEVARRVVIDATGKDARGNGTAAAKVTATLVEQGGSTDVNVVTDLNITGKPAQFGRGVMVDVGNKLIGQFATCLEGKIGDANTDTAAGAAGAPAADSGTGSGGHSGGSGGSDPAGGSGSDVGTDPDPAGGSGSDVGTDPDPAGGTEPAGAAPADAPSAAAAPAASAPSAGAPATSTPAPAPAPTRPAAASEPEPIDLLELAGGSVLTKAAPVAGGGLLLALVFFLLRRRR